MPEPTIQLDLFAVIIFLGVIQGMFLSFFFLNRKVRKKPSNLFLGFLMLGLSLVILEIFLIHTRYMYQVLRIDNFSEPLSFGVPPLMYFYIYASISRKTPKRAWIHFIPMIFWLIYSIWYFIQPMDVKQLHYLDYHFPELAIEFPDLPYTGDPLGLRTYINELVMLQLTTYLVVSILFIRKSFTTLGISFLVRKEKPISWLRNFVFLMFTILVTFVVVKSIFVADIGDYLIGSLISLIIYATSYNVIRASDFFQESVSDPLQPKKKYEKSALQEEDKARILAALVKCMEEDKDFKNPLVSLPFIAKKLNRPVHHISQVINEKLDQSFFEMIASYRVEEAKGILKDPSHNQLTIEDIADEVGYNSKSAFNRSFKKHTGITPSEFRHQT
jgi:AraC-like DNA-binding protein